LTAVTVQPHIRFESVTVGYGERVIQRDLNFTIGRGEIFAVMGPSGCGKSTLMRGAVGLLRPIAGRIFYAEESFWDAEPERQKVLMQSFGVMYQGGALWTSMSLEENVSLPLMEFLALPTEQARQIASLKLALVGLAGFEDYYPAEISGGMRKRAAIARAMALDPETLFLDEPSSGLDPISSRLLDELIVHLRDSLGTTIVIVSHELYSILGICDNSVFLDTETSTMLASGNPRILRGECEHPQVREFLTRGEA
jgi:phospholipid/cholesterol/gamma-HCH transport system ATP-binding protein